MEDLQQLLLHLNCSNIRLQLKLQKQNIANNLLDRKMDIQRQIFGDSLNAFQQKTTNAAGLANTGIKNLIGANRVQQELAAQEKANNLSNSWANFI